MKKLVMVTLLVFWTLSLLVCGHREGVETTDRKSFLYFTGYTEHVVIMIDNVPLDPKVTMTAKDRFQIQPGEHLVEVRHKGRALVRRQIYVGDGVAKEIHIPQP